MLGVSRHASAAEIRRAFRKLALALHPDRAGDVSTAAFQRVAEAYAVLGEADLRAAYDRNLRDQQRRRAENDGEDASPFQELSRSARLAVRLDLGGRLLTRVSGELDALIARADARRTGGLIELFLHEHEREAGGVALIDLTLRVRCGMCGGIARPGGFWCLRCQQTGEAKEPITVYCAVRPRLPEGSVITVSTHEAGGLEELHFCIRRKEQGDSNV